MKTEYIIGGVVLLALAAGAYMLLSSPAQAAPMPVPGDVPAPGGNPEDRVMNVLDRTARLAGTIYDGVRARQAQDKPAGSATAPSTPAPRTAPAPTSKGAVR